MHGMSEADCRAAILAHDEAAIAELQRDLRADDWPVDVIERAGDVLREKALARLERDLPGIMQAMAVQAGAASVH